MTLDFKLNQWNDFVIKHPLGNIFQTPEMYEVYLKTKNYEPILVTVINNNEIKGILLACNIKENRFLGSLTSRSIIIGGPLIKNNDSLILTQLLKKYEQKIKKKVVYSQIRNLVDTSNLKQTFIDNGFDYDEHLNILINLEKSEQELWDAMTRDRKKSIKKGQKELEVKLISYENNEYQIDSIYNLLRVVYKRVRLPLPSKEYFLNVMKSLYPKGYIKIFGAYKYNVLVGVRLVLCYKRLIYDWYAGANDDFLEYRPNDTLIWNILKWGRENGYKQFDFGGAGKPNVPYGVRDFKIKFGGEMVCFGRYQYVFKPSIMFLGKLAFKLKDGLLKFSKR